MKLDRDITCLTQSVFPVIHKFTHNYCRVEVNGLDRIPKRGPIVYVGNHGGWLPLDALVFGEVLYEHFGPSRLPIALAHDKLLAIPWLGSWLKSLGALPASMLKRPEQLKGIAQSFGVFPEGADGNCKSIIRAYQVQPFKSGFVRLALVLKAKVVPVSGLGGDECFPVLKTIKILKPLLGTVAPLPLSLIPLPVTWRAYVHKPIDMARHPKKRANDREFCHEFAEHIRQIVQRGVDRLLEDRKKLIVQ